jgi:RNA polymerase sigma factor (sigma-70 family)
MCAGHARARYLTKLAEEYLAMAARFSALAETAAVSGRTEAVWPADPGPKELVRMADDCRRLAEQAEKAWGYEVDIPDRRRDWEILAAEPRDEGRLTVEEGLLELWPGRPSTHTRISQDDWTKLTTVMSLLAPREREVIWLMRGRGLSYKQAAGEMDISPGNVYNLLARAQEKIALFRASSSSEASARSDAAD